MEVLVGIDGSQIAFQALHWASRQAQRCGDRVRIVMTWTVAESGEDWSPSSAVRPEAESRAAEVLEQSRQAVEAEFPGLAVEHSPLKGSAASILVDLSRSVDLLVVGSRGLGGFRGLLLGSVSQQCVLHAHCPVTVVRETHPPQV